MSRATPMPPEERRASILAAARPLLAAHGPSFTTKQVAEAAGIAEGTIFRVFPTKHALLAAMVDETLDPSDAIAQLAALPAGQSIDERVDAVLRILHAGVARTSEIIAALHTLPAEQPADVPADHPHGPEPTVARERSRRLLVAIEQAYSAYEDQLSTPVPTAAYLTYALAFALGHPMALARTPATTADAVHVLAHGIVRPADRNQES